MVESIVLIQSPCPAIARGFHAKRKAHVQYFVRSEDDCGITSTSQTRMLLYGPLGLWPVVGYVNGPVDVFCFVALLFVCSQLVRSSVR